MRKPLSWQRRVAAKTKFLSSLIVSGLSFASLYDF